MPSKLRIFQLLIGLVVLGVPTLGTLWNTTAPPEFWDPVAGWEILDGTGQALSEHWTWVRVSLTAVWLISAAVVVWWGITRDANVDAVATAANSQIIATAERGAVFTLDRVLNPPVRPNPSGVNVTVYVFDAGNQHFSQSFTRSAAVEDMPMEGAFRRAWNTTSPVHVVGRRAIEEGGFSQAQKGELRRYRSVKLCRINGVDGGRIGLLMLAIHNTVKLQTVPEHDLEWPADADIVRLSEAAGGTLLGLIALSEITRTGTVE